MALEPSPRKKPLAETHSDIAAEWHPTKNGDLTPADLTAGTHKKVWWICPKGPDHEWSASIVSRTNLKTGCPICNLGWTLEAIRRFVRDIRPHLNSLTPAELYVIFQQSGLLTSEGKGKAFIKSFVTGRFPHEELAKFEKGEPSLVDELIGGSAPTLDEVEASRCSAD